MISRGYTPPHLFACNSQRCQTTSPSGRRRPLLCASHKAVRTSTSCSCPRQATPQRSASASAACDTRSTRLACSWSARNSSSFLTRPRNAGAKRSSAGRAASNTSLQTCSETEGPLGFSCRAYTAAAVLADDGDSDTRKKSGSSQPSTASSLACSSGDSTSKPPHARAQRRHTQTSAERSPGAPVYAVQPEAACPSCARRKGRQPRRPSSNLVTPNRRRHHSCCATLGPRVNTTGSSALWAVRSSTEATSDSRKDACPASARAASADVHSRASVLKMSKSPA